MMLSVEPQCRPVGSARLSYPIACVHDGGRQVGTSSVPSRPPVSRRMAASNAQTGVYLRRSDRELLEQAHEQMWGDEAPLRLTVRRLAQNYVEEGE